MAGFTPYGTYRPGFDDLAEVHHRHPLSNLADHAEIMGDEEDPDSRLLTQFAKQGHDRCLRRGVKRADRLVGHEHRGPRRENAGDRQALALSA
jgi:hypothetical protein